MTSSVYKPVNDPIFKWADNFSRSWAPYDSGHSKRRRLSLFEQLPSASRQENVSAGGFYEYNNQFEFFKGTLLFQRLDENATHFLYSLLAWINQGNQFRFSLDQNFYGVIGNLTADASPSSTHIYHDSSFPLASDFEAIIYNHLGQYDKIWGVEVSAGDFIIYSGAPSYSQLSYNYTAGYSIIKYAYYYHAAESMSANSSLSLRPGPARYDFLLPFHERLDVSVLD